MKQTFKMKSKKSKISIVNIINLYNFNINELFIFSFIKFNKNFYNKSMFKY